MIWSWLKKEVSRHILWTLCLWIIVISVNESEMRERVYTSYQLSCGIFEDVPFTSNYCFPSFQYPHLLYFRTIFQSLLLCVDISSLSSVMCVDTWFSIRHVNSFSSLVSEWLIHLMTTVRSGMDEIRYPYVVVRFISFRDESTLHVRSLPSVCFCR